MPWRSVGLCFDVGGENETLVYASANDGAPKLQIAYKQGGGYVYPARHYASSNTSPNLPPMGMRVRLKSNFNIAPFPPEVQVILKALKKYGMFVADNGSNWYLSGAPDPRWSDSDLATIHQVKGSDFEVVRMGTVVTQ